MLTQSHTLPNAAQCVYTRESVSPGSEQVPRAAYTHVRSDGKRSERSVSVSFSIVAIDVFYPDKGVDFRPPEIFIAHYKVSESRFQKDRGTDVGSDV